MVPDPEMLDHVPVEPEKKKRHIHARKLKAAAERHAKPFKVATDGLPREVMVKPGTFKVVDAPEQATVTPIKRALR